MTRLLEVLAWLAFTLAFTFGAMAMLTGLATVYNFVRLMWLYREEWRERERRRR